MHDMTMHETRKSAEDFKMFDLATLSEPHEFWQVLRQTAPVHHVDEGIGYTLVTRYADVVEALRDPEAFSSAISAKFASGTSVNEDPPEVAAVMADSCPYRDALSFSDGEVHALHRRMVRRGFTTKRVRELEQFIEQVVDDLLDELVTGEPVELVSQFCERLPLQVIGEILGVERDREGDVKRWGDALMARAGQPRETLEEDLRIARDIVELHQYLFRTLADRRERPRDDFFSDLATGSEGIDDEEFVQIFSQIVSAGADTTIAWLGHIFNLLLDHPDQMAELRADPSLIPNAVEEALRIESVVKTIYRVTTRDVELGGTTIPANSLCIMLLGSADRDDAGFPGAATYDIHRADARRHVAFGMGIHLCVGAELARAEARIALRKVLERTSAISRVEGEPLPTHPAEMVIRQIDRLPVILHPVDH